MSEANDLTGSKKRAFYRDLTLAKMRASRHVDAPCFTYVFVLKEIAAIKVGISADPLKRLRNLPQFHLQIEDVFDLERSIAVFAQRREDAKTLEQKVLTQFAKSRVDAPSSPVVYVNNAPTCFAPIRWSAGGKNEWLAASTYPDVLNALLFEQSSSLRPVISMATWIKGLTNGSLQ